MPGLRVQYLDTLRVQVARALGEAIFHVNLHVECSRAGFTRTLIHQGSLLSVPQLDSTFYTPRPNIIKFHLYLH